MALLFQTSPNVPGLERMFSRDDPIQMPENPDELPPPDPAVFGAPPPPATVAEALQQRLTKYREDETKAKQVRGKLRPSLVDISFNLGTTNTQRIDLALKVRSCDVISPMHGLTSLNILAVL